MQRKYFNAISTRLLPMLVAVDSNVDKIVQFFEKVSENLHKLSYQLMI